ncbi:MAG: hypothetical protein HY856_13585 [Burkholderiales bacterium]|nr:hypothetical protein [Burkholderiales bacterium]
MTPETKQGALAAQAQPGGQPAQPGKGVDPKDPRAIELTQLVVARTLDALSKVGKELDTAMRADPIAAAVQFGTTSLRTVVMAAMRARRNIPFEVVMAAGMEVIKHLASIANEKGYLPDEQIETFLKEVLQQSMAQYAKLDMQDGMLKPGEVDAMSQKLGLGKPAQPKGALARGG